MPLSCPAESQCPLVAGKPESCSAPLSCSHRSKTLCCRSDPSRLTSGLERSHRLKRPQIDHADRVALSIRDVSVLAVGRTIVGQFALMEVPPTERRSDRHCENCEEELSQGEGSYKTGKLIRASLSIEA